MNFSTLDIFAVVALLILTVVVPLLGIWDFRRLLRWTAIGRADARIKTYNWIIAMEWGMTLGFLIWWLLAGRDLAALGLVPAAEGWQWLAIGAGLAGVLFMIYQMASVMHSPDQLEQLRAKMGILSRLAPRSPREDRLFAMVSVTAGVCEEILYRGLLMAVLVPAVGTWPAVALTSVIFGLGHAYQGLAGFGKTTLVGLVMALLLVFSGSLFIPMLLHTVIDLTSGRIMGAALRTTPLRAIPEE